jgi:hypothetical protein
VSDAFDPYHQWLGIPPKDQPPHHYRLLGIDLFENDASVIESAADRQMSHVRTFQSGPHSRLSQEVLNTLSKAKLCLLKPQQKAAYDETLRARFSVASHPPSSSPPTGPQPSQVPTPAAQKPPAMPTPPFMPTNSVLAPKNPPVHLPRAPVYQQPYGSRGTSSPPPVPAQAAPLALRKPLLGLVATVASVALVLMGVVGWLIWSRLNELQEQRMAASRASVEQPRESAAPEAVKPDTAEPPRKRPIKITAQPTPVSTPREYPAPKVVVLPSASPFVEVPANPPVVRPPPVVPQMKRGDPLALQNIYAGLTHWWGLHEVSGIRHDRAGSRDLTDRNGVGSAQGLLGNCARFNGRQYLHVPSDPSLQIRGNMTFAMWVKFSTMNTGSGLRGSHIMLGKWSASNGHDYVIGFHYIREQVQRFEFLVWETNANKYKAVYSTLKNVTADAWYFVVCQYDADGGIVGINVNDGIMATMNVGPLRTSNNPLFVGADHGPPWNSLYGDLALLGIWSRVLSPAEITALYNNGAGVDLEELELPK